MWCKWLPGYNDIVPANSAVPDIQLPEQWPGERLHGHMLGSRAIAWLPDTAKSVQEQHWANGQWELVWCKWLPE